MRLSTSAVLLLGAALLPPAAARAEEPAPSGKDKDKGAEVVVTGTRMPEQSQRATVRVDVVTREEAERRGATNVAEAIAGQPGVQINPAAYGDIGNPSAIQIQGLDKQRVLVLEDGERVIGDVGGAIDLSRMPLGDVARVEVVAGPMSSLYGTSAIGGVVNVVTGQPLHPGFSGRARLEGRNRYGVIAQGNASWRGERAWASLDGNFYRTDGVSLLEDAVDLAMPSRLQGMVGLRVGGNLNSRTRLQGRVRWIHDASEGRQSQVVPGLGTYRIDLPQRTDRFALHLVELVDLGRGGALRLALGQQWAFDTTQKDRYESPIDETRDREASLSSLEATGTFADGRRTWVVGMRAEVEKLSQSLTRAELISGSVQTKTIEELVPVTLGSVAGYAQLGWKLFDSLTLLAGGRAEMHLRYGGVVVPRLALSYQPWPSVTVRASVGRGFRAPAAKEIGFAFDHGALGYRVLGNPDLGPETSWGTSADVSYRAKNGFLVRGSVFANWIDGLIDIDIRPAASQGGIDDYTYRNIGRARTFGAQIDGSYTLAGVLRAEAGYSYLWTRDDENQRPLEGRPPHTVVTALRADLPLRLELVLRYRMVTDAFLDEGLRTPGFQTIDARIARPIFRGARAYAGVLNALGVQKDPSRLGDQRPVQGRTLYLGLTADFPAEEP
ncbi:TonB-dependent receptor [Polyangium sp. y55x31]|uniref:TonB-dependent receptor plug domain-containing protein n=1 Tax=Polyangium sp. y55x31 TaxID=3042688 RepID=UPI002482E116|nr:TonB-dependent receptor [Polyangium sp. y55x31]MDI1481974.1 TonB-dependent receptor [Polyangium sp. y55x31]